MSGGFNVRALEIHGNKMWDLDHVQNAIGFMRRYDMNALVFHSSDILQTITYPKKFFGHLSTWVDAPPRRGENAILNNRAYISNVCRLCVRAGISFYLEVKELTFPDEALELFPEVIKGGVVCPSDPSWTQFIEVKYYELFSDFPNLAGLIVSIGSPEGRATLAARRCKCDRCMTTRLSDWYRNVTAPIARAAGAHKRRLVVREFSYRPEDQTAVIDGLAELPEDVDIMVKPYPHDFYPTFPDNPALSVLPHRRKWLEYDVHGQYYGWGVMPCAIAEDMSQRFRTAVSNGASCVLLRTDWERVNDLSCFETFNRLNLAVGAWLAADLAADTHEVLYASLLREGLVDASRYNVDDVVELTRLLLQIWPTFRKALYVQGLVLNASSMLPGGVRHAWWTMLTGHSLEVWQPGAADRVNVMDDGRVDAMVVEKAEALEDIRRITRGLEQFRSSGFLNLPNVGGVSNILPLLERYVEGFVRCGTVVILAKAVSERPGREGETSRRSLGRAVDELDAYYRWLRSWSDETTYAHHLYLLLDVQRVSRILAESRATLGAQSNRADDDLTPAGPGASA